MTYRDLRYGLNRLRLRGINLTGVFMHPETIHEVEDGIPAGVVLEKLGPGIPEDKLFMGGVRVDGSLLVPPGQAVFIGTLPRGETTAGVLPVLPASVS